MAYNTSCSAIEKDAEESLLKEVVRDCRYLQPVNTVVYINMVSARYPTNYNMMIPPILRIKLELMPPDEYFQYVVASDKLNVEERKSLMTYESHRLKTFLTKWPHMYTTNLSGSRMSKAGLYYTGKGDCVACVFCGGQLYKWEADGNPLQEHSLKFSNCNFIKGVECGNIPYDDFASNHLNLVTILDSNCQETSTTDQSRALMLLGINTKKWANPDFVNIPQREISFAHSECPIKHSSYIGRLVKAGFYYCSMTHDIRCFSCSLVLRGLQPSDDPWVEHARWLPDCPNLINERGLEFILNVMQQTPIKKKLVIRTEAEKNSYYHQMRDLILSLNHEEAIVDEVWMKNGHFDEVGQWLDAVNKLEDLLQNLYVPPSAKVSENNLFGADNVDNRVLQTGFCVTCQNVPANHIGLPCGHLLFCDTCLADTQRAYTSEQHHTTLCPQTDCGKQLKGTMKVFFA